MCVAKVYVLLTVFGLLKAHVCEACMKHDTLQVILEMIFPTSLLTGAKNPASQSMYLALIIEMRHVIIGKQYHRSNDKLAIQLLSALPNQCYYFTLQT